ncbi:hypothetical protein BCh11DRAFT_06439 [Burkholderia sp. Ch1-1]|nr:hypothetical protein BCh11DRAFT_06439 [Burkholderia sp. Ch1-1]
MKTIRSLAQLVGLWLVITAALAAVALVLSPVDPLHIVPFNHSRGTV